MFVQNSYFILLRFVFVSFVLLLLSSCGDFNFANMLGGEEGEEEVIEVEDLNFGVAPHVAWMPWYLAREENYLQYEEEYKTNVVLVESDYRNNIQRFIDGELNAVAIKNIDAISQLVRQDIEADVILIMGYSNGNDGVLIPAEGSSNIRGKTFALTQYSVRHYLLDRYLVRNQIEFADVDILDTTEGSIVPTFEEGGVYGVVTANPNLEQLVQSGSTRILFDTRQTPKEIMDLIVVRRDFLFERPQATQAILAAWFSMMDRMQGARRASMIESLANLANIPVADYSRQLSGTTFIDTEAKAISSIRDRSMRKTMRHVRYFIERHELAAEIGFTSWVSYPGRNPALLHFNAEPLQTFVAPENI